MKRKDFQRWLVTTFCLFGMVALPLASSQALAQDEADEEDVIEEIVSVGSQIKGAHIADALAVTVVTSADIEAMGVDSGDELLEMIPEQGQNFLSESENISGGVNSARGDAGAFNLRNLGTGNTLVLLNGRRVVNMASYQTEQIGGSFIPVNTANTQALPPGGLERVEILRDGASAIYGADAVAGVVNYVLKTDFEGLSLGAKFSSFEGLPRDDHQFTLEWGKNFNDGRTNVSVFANYYHRDPVNSQDDPRWATDDFTDRLPENTVWTGNSAFFNSSTHSWFGQFDIYPDGSSSCCNYGLAALDITDRQGEFQIYPIGNEDCTWSLAGISSAACADEDGDPINRYNNNGNRDLYSDLDRVNIFLFLNHDFGNGIEGFTELSFYASDTLTVRQGSFNNASGLNKFVIAAENYWNPFGTCGSDNRLPDSVIGTGVPCEGLDILIDNFRIETPRLVNNDGRDFRILQGFRGTMGEWDWEAAALWSRAKKEDITHNRVSNTLFQEALNDSTSAAFNPFAGGVNSNIERALVSVRRDNETELKSIDFRMSKNDIYDLPAGPVGIVTGVEFRNESFVDDRDPRLDGTIAFVGNDYYDNPTFPEISDVMNSSPSADSSGSRDVLSAFGELQVPVLDNLDVQLALRYEDFSDVGDTTVGKFAFGWRPIERVLFRGSWSEAYRVPNLVTVNESGVSRINAVQDYLFRYVDPGDTLTELNWSGLVQRTAGGSKELVPEESTNTSLGIVVDFNEHITLTVDYWTIEKDNTIGLFGEANHIALDLLARLQAGDSNCSSVVGNPNVIRASADVLSPEALQLFADAGLCPVADVIRVDDVYKNLFRREARGHDIGLYFNYDTPIGTFDLAYNIATLDRYVQLPGPNAQIVIDGIENGPLPSGITVEGFGDLIRQDTTPEDKQTIRVGWRYGNWGAAVTGSSVGDVIQTSIAPQYGQPWILGSMTTYNASVDYRFDDFFDTRARLRFGIINVTNARAPLADDSFGYNGDMHRDLPRSFYVSLKMDF